METHRCPQKLSTLAAQKDSEKNPCFGATPLILIFSVRARQACVVTHPSSQRGSMYSQFENHYSSDLP